MDDQPADTGVVVPAEVIARKRAEREEARRQREAHAGSIIGLDEPDERQQEKPTG